MSDQAGILPKWLSDGVESFWQKDSLVTFWTMPILIFSPVQIIMGHLLLHNVNWYSSKSWKMGILLEIKVFKKMKLSKISITKNVRLNWYFSMKKKLQRFASFLTQKVDFESQISALFDDSLLHQFSSQNSIVSFCSIDLLPKTCLILYPSLGDWTTKTTLT